MKYMKKKSRKHLARL